MHEGGAAGVSLVRGGDGEGIDVWLGELGLSVVGAAWTLDLSKRNTEAKLLLGCNEDQIALIRHFYETQPQSALVLLRPTDPGFDRSRSDHAR